MKKYSPTNDRAANKNPSLGNRAGNFKYSIKLNATVSLVYDEANGLPKAIQFLTNQPPNNIAADKHPNKT